MDKQLISKQIPLSSGWDVIVVGGGPAGSTAAAASSTTERKSELKTRAPNTDWNPSRKAVSIKSIFFIILTLLGFLE